MFVIELKLNKDANAVVRQIELKDYLERFALCGLPIVKAGINFDSERKTIADWKVEKN